MPEHHGGSDVGLAGEYTLGAVITWADLLARADIQIYSKARFDKP
jgi:hypothetical protein